MKETIEALRDELTEWRRDIHQHPELAFEEERTSDLVAQRLESFGLEVTRGLAKTGVVGTLKAGGSDRAIGLRADMDALPILEQNTFEHCSKNSGKMHACGHDGHTTMLLGAAKALSQSRDFNGTVHFIFQPGEEMGAGGEVMVKDGLFERFPVERVFGMHNLPGMGVGDFALCSGPMMAAADIVDMEVTSPGGHAAMPHITDDPTVAAAQILLALQTITSRNVDPLESAVLSITTMHGGDAFNVIPDRVKMGGCVRTFEPRVQDLVEQRMREIGQNIAAAHRVSFELDYQRNYPATVNHEAETLMAAEAAAKVGSSSRTDFKPIMGSEDFSFMLNERPGAFIFTGNGASAALHTPLYDFDDSALPVGVSYWVQLVHDQLPA